MACDHSGPHSGALQYLRKHGQLRLVIVCDQCGAECNELDRLDYRPDWLSADNGTPAAKPARTKTVAA
jgi:hypothetical protein